LNLSKSRRFDARKKLLGELPNTFDIHIFEDLPLYVQYQVLGGKVLYSRDKPALVQRALHVIQECEDFKPICEYYIARDISKAVI
jgi:uncharacterized protein